MNIKLKIPFNSKLRQRARELRRSGNLSEVLLWIELKNKKLGGLDFDRQKIVGNYIVDLYCHSKLLIVEIDGNSHDEKQEYDEVRDLYFKGLGLRILHFTDLEIKNSIQNILVKILEF